MFFLKFKFNPLFQVAARLLPGLFPQQMNREELDRLRAERRAQIEEERAQQARFEELKRAQPRTEFKVDNRTFQTACLLMISCLLWL